MKPAVRPSWCPWRPAPPTVDVDDIRSLADALIGDHRRLLRSLVGRRAALGLDIPTVAERMGVSEDTVVAFERYDANPTLSAVRRYALAVHARLETSVTPDGADGLPQDGPALARTLDALGWNVVGRGPAGTYVRYGTRPLSPDVLVPLDTSAPDHDEVLHQTLVALGWKNSKEN